jgi:RNA polymerase sigma factor (sigma-70 family)
MLQRVDEAADAELISAVRGGDVDAYGVLFTRHVDAARRLARQLVPPADADDLVSEAFAKVLRVLQRGGGPDLAFRAYLLTSVRRLHVDRIRATSRVQTTDDLEAFTPGVPFRDTAVEGFENAAAARAFASLPERWQMVLWHTEVEGQKPADVAPLLGMSANSVAALAYRAREGLRQAFLTMHVQVLEDDTCAWVHGNLGAYVRNGISRRDAAKVEDHLAECRRCAAIYLELTEVNSNLAGILAPLLLGGVATAYLGTVGGVAGLAAVKGAVLLLLDRGKDLVLANLPATAAASVAAGAVVGGAVYVGAQRDPAPPAERPPAATREPSVPRSGGVAPERPTRDRSDRGPEPSVPTVAPTPVPTGQAPESAPEPPEPPTESAPPSPTEPPAPPPSVPELDLTLSASASQAAGGVFRIVVAVTGLAPGTSATLSVEGTGTAVVLTADDRCEGRVISGGACTVPADGTFDFTAMAPLPADSSLVFTVVPDAGATDADPSNNRTVVGLEG